MSDVNGAPVDPAPAPAAESAAPAPAPAPINPQSEADLLSLLGGGEAPSSQAPAPSAPEAATSPSSRERDPATGQFVKKEGQPEAQPASEPMVAFGEYGEIPLSQVPQFHQQMVEFERNQIQTRIAEQEKSNAELKAQFDAIQAQAKEVASERDSIVAWAQSDPEGFLNFVNSRGVRGAAPVAPQMAAPTQPNEQPKQGMTREELDKWYAEKRAAEFAEAQAKHAEAQKVEAFGQQIKAVIEREIPVDAWGEVHPHLIKAIQDGIVDAGNRKILVRGLPESVALRVVSNIILNVKKQFSSLRQSIATKQQQITSAVAPQPVGGLTLMPRTEPEPYQPFNEDRFVEFAQNRLKSHMNGLV